MKAKSLFVFLENSSTMACLATAKKCIFSDDLVKNKKEKASKKAEEKKTDKKEKFKKDKWRNCEYFILI